MATRPIFLACTTREVAFEEKPISFTWHAGMAPSQKKKNVAELHRAAAREGYDRVLECSSKSEDELGRRLSAFSLEVEVENIRSKVECVYQGSKVFQKGGPFPELFEVQPIEAKRFFREKNLGLITHFQIGSRIFSNEPFNAFYDWLFLRALRTHVNFLRNRVFEFDAYSDIEFNPDRSVNSQARSVAITKTLDCWGELDSAAESYESFRALLVRQLAPRGSTRPLGL